MSKSYQELQDMSYSINLVSGLITQLTELEDWMQKNGNGYDLEQFSASVNKFKASADYRPREAIKLELVKGTAKAHAIPRAKDPVIELNTDGIWSDNLAQFQPIISVEDMTDEDRHLITSGKSLYRYTIKVAQAETTMMITEHNEQRALNRLAEILDLDEEELFIESIREEDYAIQAQYDAQELINNTEDA